LEDSFLASDFTPAGLSSDNLKGLATAMEVYLTDVDPQDSSYSVSCFVRSKNNFLPSARVRFLLSVLLDGCFLMGIGR
jgi:hypothetical protein